MLKGLLWGGDAGVTSEGEEGGLCRALLLALLRARQRLGLSLPSMEAIGREYHSLGASAGEIGVLVEAGDTGGVGQDEGDGKGRDEMQVPSVAEAEAQVQGALRC